MALHHHTPSPPDRAGSVVVRATGWNAMIIVAAVHLALCLAWVTLAYALGLQSFASDPVGWIHGPPLDVPVGRGGGVSLYGLALAASLAVMSAWVWLEHRPAWKGKHGQTVVGIVGWATLLTHALLVVSLIV